MSKLRMSLIDTGSPRDEFNEPLGIEMIAGAIKEHFTEDVEVDLQSLQISGFDNLDETSFHGRRIVGISTKLRSYDRTKRILSLVSSANEDPLIVLGDLLPTFAYKQLLKEYGNVLCVRGEGENAIIDIVDETMRNPHTANEDIMYSLYRKGTPNIAFSYRGNIIETKRKTVDLSRTPIPKRDLLPEVIKRRGIVRVEASRGCPFGRCKYCCISSKYDFPGWRPFSVDFVMDELEAVSLAGAKSPYYTDEDFIGSGPDRAIKIAERIIQAKRDGRINTELNFYFGTRVNAVIGQGYGGTERSVPLLLKLKEAGLREIFIGIESGSKDQMRRYGKGATMKKNTDALSILRKLGFEVDIGFIMFDPEMSLDELRYNVDFIHDAGISYHDARLLKDLRIEPYTELETELIGKGIVTGELDVDSLKYPYKFVDSRIQRIHDGFRTWEDGALDTVYLLQAKSRGEVQSEQERTEYKAMLGEFRNLDLKFLKSCSKVADYQDSDNYIAELKRSFGERRNYLVEKTYGLIEKWRT